MERTQRKEQQGIVVSDKMDKTVIVLTKSHVKHSRYGKYYVRRLKFPAHDEKQIAKMGDLVKIRETRPLSKTKNWKVVEVLRKAAIIEENQDVAAGEVQS